MEDRLVIVIAGPIGERPFVALFDDRARLIRLVRPEAAYGGVLGSFTQCGRLDKAIIIDRQAQHIGVCG